MSKDVGIGNVKKINTEIKIITKSGENKVFLQGGFYRNTTVCDYMHLHNYTEIHLVANGEMIFAVGDQNIAVNDNTALVIPKGMHHIFVSKTEGSVHTAFQIDCASKEAFAHTVDERITHYLFAEIEKTDPHGDHTAVASVIALICTLIFPNPPLFTHDVTDIGYLITDFFSRNYRDEVRLRDLAELLHLSERQTERLVIEFTGRRFRDELTLTRMRMADQLFATTDLTSTRVAQCVGFRSYTGFWKAYAKYKKG